MFLVSQILTSAASAFMGEMLKDILLYNGLFFLIGGMSCIGQCVYVCVCVCVCVCVHVHVCGCGGE